VATCLNGDLLQQNSALAQQLQISSLTVFGQASIIPIIEIINCIFIVFLLKVICSKLVYPNGYSYAEIVEIITHVGMNILTNILSKTIRVKSFFKKLNLRKPVNFLL